VLSKARTLSNKDVSVSVVVDDGAVDSLRSSLNSIQDKIIKISVDVDSSKIDSGIGRGYPSHILVEINHDYIISQNVIITLKVIYFGQNEDNTKVRLTSQSFKFSPTTITDVVRNTKGKLSGSISHHNKFKKWFLDLKIDTDNLLVLDTKEDEEMLYYGTAFMDGNASIRGYTDKLVINVEGKTMPGTEFIVPLSDVSTIGDSGLVKFVSDDLISVYSAFRMICVEPPCCSSCLTTTHIFSFST